MNAPDYLHTDTAEDAVASFELACVFLKTAKQDSRQKLKVAKKMIAAQNDSSLAPPAPFMDDFESLYQKIQIQTNLRFTHSTQFAATEHHNEAITALNAYRNEFIHFNVKSWGIHLESLLSRCICRLEIAEFLNLQSNSILWYTEKNRERMTGALQMLGKSMACSLRPTYICKT